MTSDTRKEEDIICDIFVFLEELFVPDAAFFGFQHNDHAVRAEELLSILLEGLNIFVPRRQLLIEPSVHLQLRREISSIKREYSERRENNDAGPKN